MKKWIKRILCMTMAAACTAGVSFPVSAQSNNLNVVSLGDSIARGYGCEPEEAYGYLLAGQLSDDLADGDYTIFFQNYGTDGDTSADLLKKLDDAKIAESVKNADILTISIGGNDLMQGLFKEMATALGLDPDSPTLLADLSAEFQKSTPSIVFTKLIPVLALMKDGDSLARMSALETAFESNMSSILNRIFELNSDVVVLITTIPNPTNDKYLCPLVNLSMEDYNTFICEEYGYADNPVYICDSNQAFHDYKGEEALTYTTIDWANLSTFSLDPHPTPFGQLLIEQVHYTVLTEYILNLKSMASVTAEDATATSEMTAGTAAEGFDSPAAVANVSWNHIDNTTGIVCAALLIFTAIGFFLGKRRNRGNIIK